MLRDHDNIIKNLRQEVNALKEQGAAHEKLHNSHKRSLENHDKAIEDCKCEWINVYIVNQLVKDM